MFAVVMFIPKKYSSPSRKKMALLHNFFGRVKSKKKARSIRAGETLNLFFSGM
jgi:hypothetical protein